MLADLDTAIKAVCPIDGVARLRDGTFRIDFRPEATPEQQAAARDVVQNWAPRKRKAVAALRAEFQALPAADRSKLLNGMLAAMVADWLADNPGAARTLGVPLDGDEPA